MSGADDQLAVRNGQVDGPAAGQKGALIPEEIVVKAVRLLGNVAAMRGNLPAKKRRLMDGLCAMLDADGWLWTATRVLPDQ
ncbi:MAG: hypothetical protein KDA61_03605, partial [Planctomycetales bacterium]|nr:hypothetical protein [Planctomycetales bacterium]